MISRIRNVIACDLFTPSLSGYIDRGPGLELVERIPYFPENAIARLSAYDAVLLVATPEPVTFFGYPGIKSKILRDEQERLVLCTERQDPVEALGCLAYALHAPGHGKTAHAGAIDRPSLPTGDLNSEKVCLTLAALQPENAIIVDEAITTGHFYYTIGAKLPAHTILTVSGGSIGQGIPCATGAAIACPDRPVINFEADGSAMYTVQGLWTQARQNLNVTTLICSNRSYRILQMELTRSGIKPLSGQTEALTRLDQPAIDWAALARGFGMPGVIVSTAEELARELTCALSEPGPHLIEMLLP